MDRNPILAIVLSLGLLVAWNFLYVQPEAERAREAAAAREAVQGAASSAPGAPSSPGAAGGPAAPVDRAVAKGRAPGRIVIENPEIDGSINLKGLLVDDIQLKNFRETPDRTSAEVAVLNPAGSDDPFYARLGWAGPGAPGPDDVWTAPAGARLTPATPVVAALTKEGVTYETTLSIDDKFLISAAMTATNRSGRTVQLTPEGAVLRHGIPDDLENFLILHEGAVGVSGGTLFMRKYKKMATKPVSEQGTGGWAGITDKYWLGAAVPPQDEAFAMRYDRVGSDLAPVHRSAWSLAPREIADGETASVEAYVFAGAKRVEVLRGYEKPDATTGRPGFARFDQAVDWGNFFFLTRPIFAVLNFFAGVAGNWGVAILLLTLSIKIVLFPLANKGYESMSRMKKVQPKLKKLQDRYKDDRAKLQQEMMALYQKEKINPLAGCLPILVQMPIFYALYKTLFVTIELRHQPFLYIRDLAEQDPTTIFNLFGLLPYDPTVLPLVGSFLGVGVLPLLMGAAMWVQTKLNPPAADPMQQRIFALMPLFFIFIFAPFAAGLVLYWFWNTALSVAQQYVIMRRNGAEVNLLENMKLPSSLRKRLPGGDKSAS